MHLHRVHVSEIHMLILHAMLTCWGARTTWEPPWRLDYGVEFAVHRAPPATGLQGAIVDQT